MSAGFEIQAALAAKRALLRGGQRDDRLALAVEAFRDRLLSRVDPDWRRALELAALRLARGEPLVGQMAIAPPGRPGSFWRPAGEAEIDAAGYAAALTLPVIDWAGPLSPEPARCAEILALDLEDPARWWRLSGAVGLLGEGAVFDPEAGPGDPIRLWRHPADWLKAGAEGSGAACLLWPEPEGPGVEGDFVGFAARQVLLGPRPLVAEGEGPAALAFARWLERTQRRLRPKLPKVLVRKPAALEGAA